MKLPFKIDCPNCKAPIDMDLAGAKEGDRIPCPSCSLVVTLSGPQWEDANKAIHGLTKTIQDLGKSLRR